MRSAILLWLIVITSAADSSSHGAEADGEECQRSMSTCDLVQRVLQNSLSISKIKAIILQQRQLLSSIVKENISASLHIPDDFLVDAALHTDCTDIKRRNPDARSGIFDILPGAYPVKAFCSMERSNGWTVLQRRKDGSENFNRPWKDYRNGFGSQKGEHWLGLNTLHLLTKGKKCRLRIDLVDFDDKTARAEYSLFHIGDEEVNYQLTLGDYTGDAGDAFRGAYSGVDQNKFGFSTEDRDNDGCSPCIYGDIAFNSCVGEHEGGWWFSRCGSANLNGVWQKETNKQGYGTRVQWDTWRPSLESLKESIMKLSCT
uniref:fibrinogen-like protein 1 n=1 Tax=Myxine glutinosa TaxID=7769 RepID=UPI00358E3160